MYAVILRCPNSSLEEDCLLFRGNLCPGLDYLFGPYKHLRLKPAALLLWFIILSRGWGPPLGQANIKINSIWTLWHMIKWLDVRVYGISQGGRLLYSWDLTVLFGLFKKGELILLSLFVLTWEQLKPSTTSLGCWSYGLRLWLSALSGLYKQLLLWEKRGWAAWSWDQNWPLKIRKLQPVFNLRESLRRLSLLKVLYLCWDSISVPCHTPEKASHMC